MTREGGRYLVTATLASGSARPWTAARLALQAPTRWQVRAVDPVTADRVPAGGRLTVRWTVIPAAGAERGWLTCRGTATHTGAAVTYAAQAVAR